MKATDLRSEILPRLGHRNWIAITDAAFPEQIAPGIAIFVAQDPHLTMLSEVLAEIKRAGHVRPDALLASELNYLDEADAPGIEEYRTGLHERLQEVPISLVKHEEIIARMADTAQIFRVLVLKTSLTLPYTSVFLRLECGYWSAEAEDRLRVSEENI